MSASETWQPKKDRDKTHQVEKCGVFVMTGMKEREMSQHSWRRRSYESIVESNDHFSGVS